MLHVLVRASYTAPLMINYVSCTTHFMLNASEALGGHCLTMKKKILYFIFARLKFRKFTASAIREHLIKKVSPY